MYEVVLVIHVLITIGLIGIVLLQRSSSDGFGMGSGSGLNLLSGRAGANLLTRATAVLAATFIATSLLLGILTRQDTAPASILDTIESQPAPLDIPQENKAVPTAPATSPAPAASPAPASVPADAVKKEVEVPKESAPAPKSEENSGEEGLPPVKREAPAESNTPASPGPEVPQAQ